jgi:hypothetical protein
MKRTGTLLLVSLIVGLLLALSGRANPVGAQPSPAFNEVWSVSDNSYTGVMMDKDAQDNLYTLGYTVVGDIIVTKKYDANGVLLWSKVFDPIYRVWGRWLVVDSAGNVVVAAFKVTGSSYTPAGWVTLKYDPNGNLLWTNVIDGAWAKPARVVVDAAGNAYVAGTIWLGSCAGTTQDFVTVKYSPTGQQLWLRQFDNNCQYTKDEPTSLAVSPDGGRVAVTGSVAVTGFLTIEYDAAGNLLWSSNGPGFFPGNDVIFTSPTDAVIAANVNSVETGFKMALLKFDGAGAMTWSRIYPEGDFADRLALDGQGNILVIGRDYQVYSDWITLKTDSTGGLLWSQRYDGSKNNDEVPMWVTADAAGNVYVAGRGGPSPNGGTISYLKGVTAKYSPDGAKQWAAFTDSTGLVVRVGAANQVYFFGQGVMRLIRYEQTGQLDVLPADPANLSATLFFTGTKYVPWLTWTDNAANEFWYEIERCNGAGCANFVKVAQTYGENATSFEDETVTPGATYTYRVRAVGFMGASGYTNPFTITITQILPPAAPTNLSAAPSGANIVLTWQDNATDEIAYYVERCQGAGCADFMGYDAAGVNATSLTDYSVTPGVSYSYRVRAWNSGGYSGYSNVASATVGGGGGAPAAPSNLSATALSKTSIQLTWVNNAGNADGVKIERCKGAACTNFIQITVLTGAPTSFTDTGLLGNTSYRYRVRAYNASGDSTYSNVAMAKTLRK